jgi:hypothetical protein
MDVVMYIALLVGVPEMAPVDASRVRPLGKKELLVRTNEGFDEKPLTAGAATVNA